MWPKLMKQPEEHIAPKVAVVTTSTLRAISAGLASSAIRETSSAREDDGLAPRDLGVDLFVAFRHRQTSGPWPV